VRALLGFERRRARARGLVGRGGAVTAIQRCGSALNTNVHFHTLVGRLSATVRRRILRLVRRHGIALAPGRHTG